MTKVIKSESSHAILDPASRQIKAQKITTILRQFTDIQNARLLDIGTGAGYIDHFLAKEVAAVTSVDVVDERQEKSGYTFVQVAGEALPFEDNTFDIVVTNHVIEHVGDQLLHMREVMRVVKPGGIVYLATPNRLWITDPHYKLPFINWMPRPLATKYLRVMKKKTWDIRPVSIRTLQKYTRQSGKMDLVIAETVKNPEKYNLDVFQQLFWITKRMPMSVLRTLSHFAPTILLVVKKR